MAATTNNNLSSSVAATLSPGSKTGSPPWTQIVRGPESESIGAPTSPSESTERSCTENSENGSNAGGGKKPVWNKKPSNGPVENGGPAPVVMGPSEAWPALSESTKASPKLSSSDSSKSLPEFGSVCSPQETGIELSSSLSIAPPVQSSSQPHSASQKPTTNYLNHSPMSNHGRPARQKSMKRDGGGNPPANGGFSHQPSMLVEGSHNHTSTKPSSTGGSSDSSGRDNNQNHGHRESGFRNASGDHPQPRNSYRRGGGGSHPRGDGSHQNYGGRRGDQDRGNHDWNHSRSFNGRDATMQPRPHRNFVRPAPVSAPFVPPAAPIRPYINPMGMTEVPFIYVPPMPFGPPVPPVFIPAPDPQLHAKIVNQIDYYFSNENLIKDTYLRQNMDEHGWVPVTLIARFKKMMQLTENYQQILDAVRYSNVVEVQGDKIRRRDDWMRWIMPPSVQFPTASSSTSFTSPTVTKLATDMQNVKVDEKNIDQNHTEVQLEVDAAKILRSSSEDSSSSLQTIKDGENSSRH
ncbi:La-related protein 1C [Bienertia sinuspersici]